MKKIFFLLFVLILFLSGYVEAGSASEYTSVSDGVVYCPEFESYGLILREPNYNRQAGTITCTYDCRFLWERRIEGADMRSPANGVITRTVGVNESIIIEYRDMQNACCGSQHTDICFSHGRCYVVEDVNSCRAGAASGDTRCDCSVSYFQNGDLIREEFDTCGECSPVSCPSGHTVVDDRNYPDIICCPDGQVYANGICTSPIDAECGVNVNNFEYNEVSFTNPSESGFCSSGTLASGTPSFPSVGGNVTWVCQGAHGGLDASCRATRSSPPVPGVCGGNAGSHSADVQNFAGRADADFCNQGKPSINGDEIVDGNAIDFPEPNSQVSWRCLGSGGGSNSPECVATRLSEVVDTDAECGAAADTYSHDDSSFKGALCSRGSVKGQYPTFPNVGENVFWQCEGTSSDVTCAAVRSQPLTCTCRSVGRTQRDIRCEVFEAGSNFVVKEVSTRISDGFDYPIIFSEKIAVDDGREADCEFRVSSGCNPDPNTPPGVCPPNCKSWQHPDCDYGRYGLRIFELAFPNLHQWWNNILQGEGDIPSAFAWVSPVFSGLDRMPGTVEWFTSMACERGIDLPDDDETCELLGLPEGICEDEWDGYVNFEDDDLVVSLSARYSRYLQKNDRYEISWRMHNIEEDVLYRVFLTNINNTLGYRNYDFIQRDKRYIFPEGEAYTDASSESIKYASSIKYSDVCIEFYAGDPDTLRNLRELLGVNGGAFTCRPIAFH